VEDASKASEKEWRPWGKAAWQGGKEEGCCTYALGPYSEFVGEVRRSPFHSTSLPSNRLDLLVRLFFLGAKSPAYAATPRRSVLKTDSRESVNCPTRHVFREPCLEHRSARYYPLQPASTAGECHFTPDIATLVGGRGGSPRLGLTGRQTDGTLSTLLKTMTCVKVFYRYSPLKYGLAT
jgi:hypothetical protein